MKCPRCEHDNEAGAKFCEECATPLARACTKCGRQLSPAAKFCPECAYPTGLSTAPPPAPQFASPESYTPKHFAVKILTSKAALEGERKQVTVLFADLKGSMELLADRDPEEARKILDPVLTLMMDAVHHYERAARSARGAAAMSGAPRVHRLLGGVDGVSGIAKHCGVRRACDGRDRATPTGQRSCFIGLERDVVAVAGDQATTQRLLQRSDDVLGKQQSRVPSGWTIARPESLGCFGRPRPLVTVEDQPYREEGQCRNLERHANPSLSLTTARLRRLKVVSRIPRCQPQRPVV
jgi:hypothetical protein